LILIALGSWPLLLCLSLLAALPRDSETFASGFFHFGSAKWDTDLARFIFRDCKPALQRNRCTHGRAPDATSTFSRSTSLSDHGVFFVGMALAQVSDTQFANLNSQFLC